MSSMSDSGSQNGTGNLETGIAMANFLADLQSFLPVPPGTFSDPPPKRDEDRYNAADRAKQSEEIKGENGEDMNEAEPKTDAPAEPQPVRSQMTKPLAPIEAGEEFDQRHEENVNMKNVGVEECDLCGRWKSKCRMREAIRMSHVRRGTVICGQCTVMLEKVPTARIVPPSIPDVSIGPSMVTDKRWKHDILKSSLKMPSRPPPAFISLVPRNKEKEFSPEDLDNDFKYQNLFEVLFSPDLHLLSAMFEVMPEDEEGDELLAAVLRLVDRSGRTEQIMKACVEMEVANTLDATTMFRRNNMSLRILKMHMSKVVALRLIHRYLHRQTIFRRAFLRNYDYCQKHDFQIRADAIKMLALNERFAADSSMAGFSCDTFETFSSLSTQHASAFNDDAWEHSDPKKVMVYSKDVPDLLRLIVNKMEIIERHAYLQEQQHEELRGSFLRLRVNSICLIAHYSSGIGSRYGTAAAAPLPYETDEGDWNNGYGQYEVGAGQENNWNSAAEAAMQGISTPPKTQELGPNAEFIKTVPTA
ncbi:hypothetical protein GUITHDRAFT_163702 [Guillardia theta CCMP2712]|uniref:Uncharacterized protein n=1 Tax=Guillardia theta (strain CCMP2712) TaxID=905079 RepID=L1J7D0_GUITC|nr:hypothetical protein GUITHDRAFT_163702 [Guillardia theta CCMP2712]EKX43985.1 hypothetical protein GUITHDRAFT_163702 [Guillardia theta CCMP2712]|eukprot:XP_005830965.1 hypothetical protein GUITHDRAFT_163702 [Guillardia theta CCMP2712]